MAEVQKKSDILVIGAGIAGLSTAYHLKNAEGIASVNLIAEDDEPVTSGASGWCIGGFTDNFTRLSHAHGAKSAGQLWEFGDEAYRILRAFAQSEGISAAFANRVRLIVSEHENKESERAVAELGDAGVKHVRRSSPDSTLFAERVMCVQEEPNLGGYVEPATLLARLEDGITIQRAKIVSVKETPKGVVATDAAGKTYQGEMCVLATHLGTRALLPSIEEAFVPVVEQWIEYTLEKNVALPPGFAYSANHSYEWGVFTKPNVIRLGGGRFLRKLAGIGVEQAEVDPRITTFLSTQIESTFAGVKVANHGEPHVGLDCRPCDEMPIIGPMFGSNRILLASGFMGQGMTLGFAGGKALAELIGKGRSELLPRLIYPERLRTI